MKLSLFALLLISAVTNQPEAPLVRVAQLDQESTIKIGQESQVDKLRIKFSTVAKDNRCACERECASFHYAVVLLSVGSPQREDKYVVFYTNSKSKEVAARGYKISLIKVHPCPEENGDINRDEYEVTLRVTKDQAAHPVSNGATKSKPNFSGTWSFSGVDAGTSIRIVHRGNELRVTFEGFARGSTSVSKDVYNIDGRPHTTTRTEYRKDGSTNKVNNYTTRKVKSIVRWEGDKLVLVVEGQESKWELSETGQELIHDEETVYKRIS